MKIEKITDNTSITIKISGELTSSTSDELSYEVKNAIHETDLLILDIENLEYAASAGLRVFLEAHKLMAAKNGKLTILNTQEEIMRIFEITGFCDIFDLK